MNFHMSFRTAENIFKESGDDNFNLIYEKASQEWSGFYLRE